jgi:predicted acetyltransferase
VTIEIRLTQPHEYRLAANAFVVALMVPPPTDEQWERSLPSWQEAPSYSAWDGDICVGHGSHDIVDTTVPGGARLSTSAVTRVGILPTYRRRGLGTGLMRALIDDAVQRDLVLMSLRASEAVIYQRYGFGVAGDFCEATIDPQRVSPIAGAATEGSFRILEPDEIVDTLGPLYERVAHRRPGVLTRPRHWTTRQFRAAIERKEASFVAVHHDVEGEPDGYVHYTVTWSDGMNAGSTGLGDVHELLGATDAVELALWQYIVDTDLVTRWKTVGRPADDLVRLAANDSRGYQQTSIEDEQWLRLIDADRALRGRSYHQASGSVTIRVADPLIPANNGTWRISAEGAERTDDAPDLSVGIETISAVYLGGPSWAALAVVDDVEVTNPGAIATADTLFASRPLPWGGTFF